MDRDKQLPFYGLPKVYVITVCRNALESLRFTWQSVASQKIVDLSHVVVDGASTDGTPEWLDTNRHSFAAVISEPDQGIYDAMNKAISLCVGADWIIFLNAGDGFATETIVGDVFSSAIHNCDFIFGGVTVGSSIPGKEGKTYRARFESRYHMPGCHQSCFVKAQIMTELKFDLKYKVAADFDFWMKATHEFGCKTNIVDFCIARVAPEGFSALNESLLQEEYVRVITRYRGRLASMRWLLMRKIRRFVKNLVL